MHCFEPVARELLLENAAVALGKLAAEKHVGLVRVGARGRGRRRVKVRVRGRGGLDSSISTSSNPVPCISA